MANKGSPVGYDGCTVDAASAADSVSAHSSSNQCVVSRMRLIHGHSRHSLTKLTAALHSAFPAVHSAVTLSAFSASSAAPTTSDESLLEAVVRASSRRCAALYGGGESGRDAGWCGLNVDRVSVSAPPSQSSSGSRRSSASAAYLVGSLPHVMRVQIALSESEQPAGTLRSVRVLSWEEEGRHGRHSPAASRTDHTLGSIPASSSATSANATHGRSAASLSCRHVMQLVQAELTAHLHRCNSLRASEPRPSEHSLSCPLFHFLVHVGSYHNLFTAPCVGCGELMTYHNSTANYVPPVARTLTGRSLHATCRHALHSDIPTNTATSSSTATAITASTTTAATSATNNTHTGSNGATQLLHEMKGSSPGRGGGVGAGSTPQTTAG